MITYILLGLLAIALAFVWATYNRLIQMRFRMREALSDIDVQSKRRYDLIPNLIETVKGYAKQESSVLEGVTKARTSAMSSSGNQLDKAGEENMLSGALKTLFAVSENYPDLKSNTNFLHLQQELVDTENKMQASRRFYNSTVRDLNTQIEVFPANLIADMFGFHPEKFFEVSSEVEKEPVKVKF